jgi:putative heme-binding domain-containing protein
MFRSPFVIRFACLLLIVFLLLAGGAVDGWAQNIGNSRPAEKAAPLSTELGKHPAKPRKVQKDSTKNAKPPRKNVVGDAVGANKATPVDKITVAKDFRVELIYSVPGKVQGSWVNLCVDPKGRLIVSDQFGSLYRIELPKDGRPIKQSDVVAVPAPIRAVNGMMWVGDALYVGVNDYESKIACGLYRLTDSDGDDNLDHVELLREIEARGDHGVHALVPTQDGNGLFLVCGNGSKLTQIEKSSPVPQIWGEDHLLPRMPDGRGFMRDVLAPGGVIYRVSLDGKKFEAYANGFRNVFDAAMNRSGDLFTYDADMEYDFNTSWYRPTRINHVVSGGEFGWRNGAGKRPAFYPDNLPAVIDIGPGSPTGVVFGYGAKFPTKYQEAMYALDWSWGKLYAIHLEADGASYKAKKEEFVTGAPLPITDAVIHPGDGSMYFTIGGRAVQSGLYRVSYVGSESTTPITSDIPRRSETREKLERFHGVQDPAAIEVAWKYLADSDRYIRFAARTAIEHQPVEQWASKAVTETDPLLQVEALMALARVSGVCPQHQKDATVDVAMKTRLLNALKQIDPAKLDDVRKLTYLRTLQITFNRFGRPDQSDIDTLVAAIDPLFPATSPDQNWLLCETLAYLESATVVSKALDLIESAPTQEEQIEYARSLRLVKAGWNTDLRTRYFQWFLKAANYRGGSSFQKFIEFIRNDAVASIPADEKIAMKELLGRKPERISALENLGKIFEGRTVTAWTLDELSKAASVDLTKRDMQNGQRMFSAAGCFACHRFDNQGGMTGPDLSTAGRRYSTHDFLDQIINPSKVINDQFSSVVVLTDEGRVHNGVVVNLSGDTITLNTDLSDPNQRISIDRTTIEELSVSEVSAMPTGLLDRMTKEEILDLLAYVLNTRK